MTKLLLKTRINCFLLLLFQLFFDTFSQGYQPVNIPSPQAYSFFRYSEIPVSYVTGLPNINIPIFLIKEGNIEVPITLSYHAGTIRPFEQAGWVGLGWTLNVGGVITRKIESMRDEENVIGWFFNKPSNLTLNDVNQIDGAPDIFSYSFNGHCGKFLLDESNNFVVVPYDNIKVELITENDDYLDIDGVMTLKDYWYPTTSLYDTYFQGFRITNGDGNIYEFKQIEYSFPKGVGVGAPGYEIINTWYLTRIISANKQYEISFTYQKPATNKFHVIKDPFVNTTIYLTYNIMASVPSSFSTSLNELVYLKEITTKTSKQKVEFSISTKNDLQYPYNRDGGVFQVFSNCNYLGHKLDNIKISQNNNIIKSYQFNYSEDSRWKLKLTSVQELSSSNISASPPYQFLYSTKYMTYYSNYDQWGYYNIGLQLPINVHIGDINGRKPHIESYNTTEYPDILTKIIYPSGGYTSFKWEQNDFSKVADNNYHVLEQFNY